MIVYLPHRPRGYAVPFEVYRASRERVAGDNMPWRILMCLAWQRVKAGDLPMAFGIISRRYHVVRSRP